MKKIDVSTIPHINEITAQHGSFNGTPAKLQETFAERMTNRARGVADLLSERLTSDMMAGVPIIARADGSVGDVGTTWWDKAMEEDNVSKGFDLWILGTEDTMANRPKTDEMEQGKTVAASAASSTAATSVAALATTIAVAATTASTVAPAAVAASTARMSSASTRGRICR